jgi:hypothetical protein
VLDSITGTAQGDVEEDASVSGALGEIGLTATATVDLAAQASIQLGDVALDAVAMLLAPRLASADIQLEPVKLFAYAYPEITSAPISLATRKMVARHYRRSKRR